MTRDDVIAALERAADMDDYLVYDEEAAQTHDAVLLRALADALREGQMMWQRGELPIINSREAEDNAEQFRGWRPVWIIPEPRIARRALSGEGE